MNKKSHLENSWSPCPECKGRGKKSQRIRKNVRLSYLRALDLFENSDGKGIAPTRPKGHLYSCINCSGSGLKPAVNPPEINFETFPNVAIIGGGIGGAALAVACLHRGIPFTLFERDKGFDARSQGYGLTLQQASKAIEGLGIMTLKEGVNSTRHVVHTTDGKIIGEWGMRKWVNNGEKTIPNRTNIHISRQSLRLALLEQLGGQDVVQWDHQFIDFKVTDDERIDMSFDVAGTTKSIKADLLIGADGIRSAVRKLVINEDRAHLQYLDCIVILGICSLAALEDIESSLLDSATVFQTANGNERIYMMPYDSKSIMWQLSFPMPENEAIALSALGPKALKKEAILRTPWHDPIPQILEATQEAQISGYPVYDRELLSPEMIDKLGPITLIGDAAHPMSPFKGQGANQALLDALSLARMIYKKCRPQSPWKETGIRNCVLKRFETEMLERTASKVKDSAAAAKFLHTDVVLHEGDEPRGRVLKRDEK
ncbi:FAD-dependent oxidoreductase [Nonlabens antarcticus]|uniref:FAD-dependent oxidoreductase n=1 Tax=Nonlabens antarcticus TaxID=392714 RepID=UPI001891B81C|nr:NAD(P)/FAD-dependent oxidoreductase [Nonlabens antarcticus]